ncbi:HAD-IIA family hydrolase [Actinospongicola halichondriae]|uniref:HAD-IIA family hydrolase n=1 Tax=Actinospongicola halichondriae TaxID=3236844 RepID=UPI003D376357
MPWVLDLDGVLWLGAEPIPGSADAVHRLRAAGETVVFATNNAYARVADQEAKLEAMGIPAVGSVVTAAQAGASLLDAGERVLVVGGPGLREEVERRGAVIVTERPYDAVISGLDRELTYAHLRDASTAIRNGARWVQTNGDVTFPTPDGPEPGAGTIAAALAAASGMEPVVAGKPEQPMADLIRARLGDDGYMVGDRPNTDGLFAGALGYRFCLAMSGITTEADLPVDPEPWCVGNDLATIVDLVLSGVSPHHTTNSTSQPSAPDA